MGRAVPLARSSTLLLDEGCVAALPTAKRLLQRLLLAPQAVARLQAGDVFGKNIALHLPVQFSFEGGDLFGGGGGSRADLGHLNDRAPLAVRGRGGGGATLGQREGHLHGVVAEPWG